MSTGLKPYPAYKDSGVEWLGRIPAHWQVKPLKYFLRSPIAYGVLKPDKYDGPNGVPLIRILDVSQGQVAVDALELISPAQSREYARTLIRENDVVVSVVGTLGRSFIVRRDLEGANLSRALARIQLAHGINPTWLNYFFQTSCFLSFSDSIPSGTAQRVLNLRDLSNVAVPLPDPHQQQIGCRFLDRETGKIDALVAKKERLIELLQEKRTALISHAVTQGLNPNAPRNDSGIPWLGRIPAHWKTQELRRLVCAGTTITYGIVQAGPDVPGGIPYIRTSDMSGDELPPDGYLRTSPEIDASYRRSKVAVGDIVVAIRASVGKALLVPPHLEGANLTQGTAKVSPGPLTHRRYLLYALNSTPSQQRFSALAKGATFREITLDMLRRLAVPLPPLSEQEAIAAYLDAETAKLDALTAKVRRAIERLQEYRTALISAAVTGQIDVRDCGTGVAA